MTLYITGIGSISKPGIQQSLNRFLLLIVTAFSAAMTAYMFLKLAPIYIAQYVCNKSK